VILKLLTFGFTLLTFALGFGLLMCWYFYSGAEFDCADLTGDVATCVAAVHRNVGFAAALAVALWGVIGGLLVWAWKKY
jgi:hypothetical protein